MGKHVIVMSVDAMVFEDLAQAAKLPHFHKVLANGSRVERVKTLYPSLTHPIHAAIMSGAYPERTGIPNNVQSLV